MSRKKKPADARPLVADGVTNYGTNGDAETGNGAGTHGTGAGGSGVTPLLNEPRRFANPSFVLDRGVRDGTGPQLYFDPQSSDDDDMMTLQRTETTNDLRLTNTHGILTLLASLVLFSQVPSSVQLLYRHDPDLFTPCTILCAGNLVALCAFPAMFWKDLRPTELRKRTKTDFYNALASAALYSAVGPALQFTGLRLVPVRTMAILQRLEGVNIIVATNFLQGLAMSTWTRLNAIAIVTCVIAYLYVGTPESHDFVGSALVVASGWAYSASLYITKTAMNDIPPGQILVFRASFGTAFYHVYAWLSSPDTFRHLYSYALWRFMLFYGLMYVVTGQLMWTLAMRLNPPALLSVGITALFPLQIFWAVWMLGDWPPRNDMLATLAMFVIVISGSAEICYTLYSHRDVQDRHDVERLDATLRHEGPYGDIQPNTPAQYDLLEGRGV